MTEKEALEWASRIHKLDQKDMARVASIMAVECLNRGYGLPEGDAHPYMKAHTFMSAAMAKLDPL